MAKGLNVKLNFQVDTSQAKQNIRELYNSINQITKAQNSGMNLGITQQLQESVKTAQLLKTTLAQATDFGTGAFDLSKFTTAMNQNMQSINQFKAALQSLGPEGEKAFNNLGISIAKASTPLSRTNGMIDEIKTSFANSLRWSITSSAIRTVTAEVSKAFNYVKNLDSSLNKIQIVTGHSADYMKDFAKYANSAAKELSASTLEYTNAALIYYQQGLSDQEVKARTETTIKMAKVTGESASKISQDMTAIWNNFSNGVDNLERYADVITALGATTASSSSEIAKGVEKFAGISKTIGLSYDYATSALATVTAQTRQSADSVGTAFKTLFSRLESINLGDTLEDGVTLNKYSEALLKVGVNILDVNGQLKSMDTILDDLGNQWNNLTQAQQVALAQTVGGVRNYTSLITLMDNWDQFQTNLVTAQLSTGTLTQQADIYAKSWEAAKQRVTTSMQTIYSSVISSDFMKGLNNVTSYILDQVGAVSQALGSSGTFSAIHMIANSLYGDKFISGINNLENNLLGSTAAGSAFQQQQQQYLLQSIAEEGGFTNKELLAEYRTSLIEATTKQSNVYAEEVRKIQKDSTLSTEQKNTQINASQATLTAFAEQSKDALNTLVDASALKDQAQYENRKELRLMTEYDASKRDADNYTETFNKTLASWTATTQQGAYDAATKTFVDNLASIEAKYYRGDYGKDDAEAAKAATAAMQSEVDAYKKVVGRYSNVNSSQTADKVFNGNLTLSLENGKADETGRTIGKMSEEIKANSKSNLENAEENGRKSAYERGSYGALEMRGASQAEHAQRNTLSQRQLLEYQQKQLRDNTITTGKFALGMSQALNATNMASNSIKNFGNSLINGTASVSGFTTMLGSSALAFGQWSRMFSGEDAQKMISGITANTAFGRGLTNLVSKTGIAGLTTSVDLGNGAAMTGLTAAGGAGVALAALATLKLAETAINIAKGNSLESRVSYANESKISLNAQAKENKQLSDNFKEAAITQNESVNKLINLQAGTVAYTSQLIASNQSARELIDTYGLESTDYTIGKNGTITFSAEQINSINDRLLENTVKSDEYAQIATSNYNQMTYQKQMTNIQSDIAALQATAEHGAIVDTEEYTKQMQELQNQQRQVELQQAADYENTLYSIYNAQEEQTDAMELAIGVLGMQAVENGINSQEVGFAAGATGGHYVWWNSSAGKFEFTKSTHTVGGKNYRSIGTLEKMYQNEFGEVAPKGLSQSELAGLIESKRVEQYYLDQINTVAGNIDASMAKDYSNFSSLRYTNLNGLLETSTTKTSNKESIAAYNSLNQLVLTRQAESQDNLAQALLHNTTMSQFQNQSYIDTAKQLQQSLDLSIDQTNNLANYINNFGTNFGEQTGQYIYDALTHINNGTTEGWNQQFYDALQNVSTTSSIASIASLQQYSELTKNADLKKSLDTLSTVMIEDINDRGGLAKALFTSNDFQNVFSSLSDVYKTTGQITAENIAKVAEKNETLNAYLMTNDNNTAAVADMVEMVASGAISISEFTPAVTAFVNEAATGGWQQKGLEIVENQDLSTSYSEVDDYFQNGGKAWYTAVRNDMLNDAPFQEFLSSFAVGEDYQKVQQILYEGRKYDTNWMVNQIKTQTPELYDALQTLQGTGKYKGKGGGGLDTALTYLGNKGVFEGLGLTVDENGTVQFDENFGTEYWTPRMGEDASLTSGNFYDYFVSYFEELEQNGQQVFTKNQARNYATFLMGELESSSLGVSLGINGVLEGREALIEELTSEENGNQVITGDALSALYEANRSALSVMKYDEETGEFKKAEDGEVAGITEDQFIEGMARAIKENGGAIIDLKGLQSRDLKDIAQTLSINSHQTLDFDKNSSGAQTIIQAAVAAGVTAYNDLEKIQAGENEYTIKDIGKSLDFEELQNFYTETLGLTTDIFIEQLPDIVAGLTTEEGQTGALSYQYQDIWGVQHTLSTRSYTDQNGKVDYQGFADAVAEAQAGNPDENFFYTQLQNQAWEIAKQQSENGYVSYTDYEKALNQLKANATAEAKTIAQEESGNVYITPDKDKDEEEEEGTEGTEGATTGTTSSTTGAISSTTGTVGKTTTDQAYDMAKENEKAAVGEYENYTYQGGAEAEEVYRYNLEHPTLTPAEAWDAVHYGGARAVRKSEEEVRQAKRDADADTRQTQREMLAARAEEEKEDYKSQYINNKATERWGTLSDQQKEFDQHYENYQNALAAGNNDLAAKELNILKTISQDVGDISGTTSDIAEITGENTETSSGGPNTRKNGNGEEDEEETEQNTDLGVNGEQPQEEGGESVEGDSYSSSWQPPVGGKEDEITSSDARSKIEEVGKNANAGDRLSYTYQENGVDVTVSAVANGDGTVTFDGDSSASGQNNARILGFASGKDYSHIAVTGELGPELRIKEDGSAELLGKKGREYAWVEPNDIIYTAAQTASILGSNNIPALQALAKGINNYIPGYSDGDVSFDGVRTDGPMIATNSGWGSLGSGKEESTSTEEPTDPRYDENTLKIRDILTRYYTILEKLDDIIAAIDRFATAADRAWGEDRIKLIEEQTELYKQEYAMQKEYVNEISEYLKSDEAALDTMIQEFISDWNNNVNGYPSSSDSTSSISGMANRLSSVASSVSGGSLDWSKASFDPATGEFSFGTQEESSRVTMESLGAEKDSKGNITNYDEVVKNMVAMWNENAETNAQDSATQYKLEQQLYDIQFYTDTLNTYQEQVDKLTTLANQILDNSLKEITYRVEYELELNNDLASVLDFKADLVADNVYRAAEYLALLDEEMTKAAENIKITETGLYDYLGKLAPESMRVGKTYTTSELGITELINGVEEELDYNDINFQQVTKNLDTWIAELKSKDAEAAKEITNIIKRDQNGLITNYREVFLKLNSENERLSKSSINLLKNNVEAFFKQISDLSNNPSWAGLTTDQKNQLESFVNDISIELDKIRSKFEETINTLGDSIKAFARKMNTELDEFDFYNTLYSNFSDIVDLTNRRTTDISSGFFQNLHNRVFQNNVNQIMSNRTNVQRTKKDLELVNDEYQKMINLQKQAEQAGNTSQADFYQDQVDNLKKQINEANSAYEDAVQDLQDAWINALQEAKDNYSTMVQEAARTFEDSFSPLFHTLDLLELQYGREKALKDLYADDYQRIHDLSKLNRDIEQSILDTDNLKSKQRLRDMQKEINKLQENGTKLSAYDLDILDKKYKLELARQALEDARDAKSLVRLSRDNNGNWGYVYTANEDDVADAEQAYEDAIRDLEEANDAYINNLEDQILQVQKDAKDAILSLNPDDFGTWEEYWDAIMRIYDNMNQQLNFLAPQMKNALTNNQDLDSFIKDIYGINDHDLTTDYKDTILAKLLGVNSLDQMVGDALERLQTLGDAALDSWKQLDEEQRRINKEGTGTEEEDGNKHLGENLTKEIEKTAKESEQQVKNVEDLSNRISKAFIETANQVSKSLEDWRDDVMNLTNSYELLLNGIMELKRLDGEQVEPAKMRIADNALDTWREVKDFKNQLGQNGTLVLITTDANGKEHAQTFTAGTAETNAFIRSAMETAARNDIQQFNLDPTKDESTEGVTRYGGLATSWGGFDSIETVSHELISSIGDFMSYDVSELLNKYRGGKDEVDLPKVYAAMMDYLKRNGIVIFTWKGQEHIAYSEDDPVLQEIKSMLPTEEENNDKGPYGLWDFDPNNPFMSYIDRVPFSFLSGGYTGRWQSALSGMYTGEWPSGSVENNGRLAWLHQKELVLNAHDTENFLSAMEIVRELDNLSNWMANGLGDLFTPTVQTDQGTLEQNVHIEASFPNVQDHHEIEQAFDNIVNLASQYANRK